MARRREFNPFLPRDRQNWTCTECNNVNTYQFEECDWCGTSKDSNRNPREDRGKDLMTKHPEDAQNPFFQHSGSMTMYYRSSYFGQDAVEVTRGGNTYQLNPTRGLTQWVADNYELLDLGNEGLGDERKVNQDNRAHWSRLANSFLDRLYPLSSVRTCFRKSIQFKDSDQWDMFPHPEDAIARKLVGINGELPDGGGA